MHKYVSDDICLYFILMYIVLCIYSVYSYGGCGVIYKSVWHFEGIPSQCDALLVSIVFVYLVRPVKRFCCSELMYNALREIQIHEE